MLHDNDKDSDKKKNNKTYFLHWCLLELVTLVSVYDNLFDGEEDEEEKEEK